MSIENNQKQEIKKEQKEIVINKKSPIVRDSIISIVLFIIGLFLLFSSFNLAGYLGNKTFNGISFVFGWISYLIFIPFIFVSYRFWTNKYKKLFDLVNSVAVIVMVFSITSFTASIGIPFSGKIGELINFVLKTYLGNILPSIISLSLFLITFILVYNDRPKIKITKYGEENLLNNALQKSKSKTKNIFLIIFSSIKNIFKKRESNNSKNIIVEEDEMDFDNDNIYNLHSELLNNFTKKEETESKNNLEDETEYTNTNEKETKIKISKIPVKDISKNNINKKKDFEEKFVPPSLDLLNGDSGKSSAGDSKSKMNTIQKVLDQFNIPVEMGEVTVGPSVTQFTLKPAQDVRIKSILSLKDNLQMALAATNMHIEAPIPGKPFVGIEIPNEKTTKLGLRSLLELEDFKNSSPLTLAIGKNIVGKPVFSDLSKMPHLLVAGATGVGKSVTLHNIILSLLYKNSPNDLKLIILDPKRVDFPVYNSLPHMYTPVVKDAKTAIKVLNWAAQEMDRRYDILGEYKVANLTDYNKKIIEPSKQKTKTENNAPRLPFIVIVFDEFNDFMLSYSKELTPIVTSLTQKARAAGIHLILTTQRPDVRVITGTIKANIPSRIALKTTTQIDSRTILDQAGAEDLLGNGDMLYMNGSRIIRVQAPFVSTEEVEAVVHDIKEKYEDYFGDTIDMQKVKSSSISSSYKEMQNQDEEEPEDDEDYQSAKDYILATGRASKSALQTAFGWGYNRAARTIDKLERFNIIGPDVPGKRLREILVKDNRSDVEKLEEELDDLEKERNIDE